jgi:hypothetical protein
MRRRDGRDEDESQVNRWAEVSLQTEATARHGEREVHMASESEVPIEVEAYVNADGDVMPVSRAPTGQDKHER